MEEGEIKGNEMGTPQGGVISPLLANIDLNQLDRKWEEVCTHVPEQEGDERVI